MAEPVQSCVPGTTVCAVVTHIDIVSADELQRKREKVQEALKKWQDKQHGLPNAQYLQIVRVLKDGRSHGVDCLGGDGISELRSVLLDVAETTRGLHEPLPRSWMNLRKQISLRGETKKFISWTEYTELCKQ